MFRFYLKNMKTIELIKRLSLLSYYEISIVFFIFDKKFQWWKTFDYLKNQVYKISQFKSILIFYEPMGTFFKSNPLSFYERFFKKLNQM